MGLFKRNRGKYEDISEFRQKLYRTMATTSKQLIWIYTVFGVVWISLSYVLAFMGKEQIAESLSSTVCNVVIGTLGTYLITSTVENIFKYNNFGGKPRVTPTAGDDTEDVDISQIPPDM